MSNRLTTYVQDDAIDAIEQDTFGHAHVAEAVIESILDSRPPFIIGIFGGWGTGKSSLLQMICEKLGDAKIPNVTIDAWRYTASDNLQRAFLVHVTKKLDNKNLDKLRRRLYSTEQETVPLNDDEINRLTKMGSRQITKAAFVFVITSIVSLFVVLLLALIVHYATTGSLLDFNYVEVLNNVGVILVAPLFLSFFSFLRLYVFERPVTFTHERIDADELFYEHFENVVDAATRKVKERRLVVFVDNLDRLNDEKIIEALESLKTYISNDNCIFVVACDDNVVRSVINRSKTIPAQKVDGIGEHYLDKFFQQTFRLPEYLGSNLQDFAVQNFETTKLHEELKQQEVDISFLVSVLLPLNAKSPRKVKRLLNDFIALYEIVRRKESEVGGQLRVGQLTSTPYILAKFSTLRSEFPNFYQLLIKDNSLLDKFTEVALANDPANSDAFLKKISLAETEQASLPAYLQKTATIPINDVGVCIWLSQDRIALGLKQEHVSQIREYLPSNNADGLRKLCEGQDQNYTERLIEAATRIVQEELQGLDQQNGSHVLASLLGDISEPQRNRVANVVGNLIPSFITIGFSAKQALDILKWARNIPSQQIDRIFSKLLEILRNPSQRVEAFVVLLKNMDLVDNLGQSPVIKSWHKSFFAKDSSAFTNNDPPEPELTPEKIQEDISALVVGMIDVSDYCLQISSAIPYYFGGYSEYLASIANLSLINASINPELASNQLMALPAAAKRINSSQNLAGVINQLLKQPSNLNLASHMTIESSTLYRPESIDMLFNQLIPIMLSNAE